MAIDTKSRLHRRVAAARTLADDLVDQGQPRMAQVIRDLCISALASSWTNAQLHRDNAALRASSPPPSPPSPEASPGTTPAAGEGAVGNNGGEA